MSEIVLIILTWLPVVAESGLFVLIVKFISRQLKEHFSLPKRVVDESKALRSELAATNKKLLSLSEENIELKEEVHKLILELRGIKANESIKKN